jgi:integrase/recombinase XerD
MRLIFATDDFAIAGRSFKGFPLLIGNDGWPVEPAQTFLWEILIQAGTVESPLTWDAYGRRLYDFFAFLTANKLDWDEGSTPSGLSVVSKYRDWSLSEIHVASSTLNKRLNLVVRFYEWCKRQKLIEYLPFSRHTVRVSKGAGFLAHVRDGPSVTTRPTILVKEYQPTIKLLTKEQTRVCFGLKLNSSHRLLFHLMVRVGLRSCEARTFPLKYVVNPRTQREVVPGAMFRVALSPQDMEIKFNKPRTVDIPWSLMEDMWSYSLHERERRRQITGGQPNPLILTEHGTVFSKNAVGDAMNSIARKAGFPVRAHMLRHSYATYTLAALRKNADFSGEPLLYVRDRLGHSDVQTTSIYLHLINQLEAHAVLAHEDAIDLLFTSTAFSEEAA